MWNLDHKGGWSLKNWCFWIVLLEKTLESPLDCKEIQPVHPKGDQSWISIGRTDAEAPIFWSPVVKSRLTGKDPEGRRSGWQGMKCLGGITNTMAVSLSQSGRQWSSGKPGVLGVTGSQRVSHDLVTEQPQNTWSEQCGIPLATGDGMTWITF